MPTKELRQVRMSYTSAYAAYNTCLQTIAEESQLGHRPTDQTLREEQTAFNALVNAREAFFDALLRYGPPPRYAEDSK